MRLDFLVQELNREANTLASKSADTETTRRAVDMKVSIEQIREQVQRGVRPPALMPAKPRGVHGTRSSMVVPPRDTPRHPQHVLTVEIQIATLAFGEDTNVHAHLVIDAHAPQ